MDLFGAHICVTYDPESPSLFLADRSGHETIKCGLLTRLTKVRGVNISNFL